MSASATVPVPRGSGKHRRHRRHRASSKSWLCGASEPMATSRGEADSSVQPVEWDARAVVLQSLILYTTNTV